MRGLQVVAAAWLAVAGMATAGLAIDFSQPEPGEELPGGAATHAKAINHDVFSQSSANMSFAKELEFKVGNGFFRRQWVTAPASTKASDGLGPLFNSRACQNCHLKDGRGHPPAKGEEAQSMFLRLSIPPQTEEQKQLIAAGRGSIIPEPTYGAQLQNFAIAGHAGEGRMVITYKEQPVQLADGVKVSLRAPAYTITDLGYGPMHPQTMTSPRVAPPMIGLGLLEAIPEEAILARADPDDKDGDGISGRPNYVRSLETEKVALGRFGWKAGSPTVRQQSADAFNGDIGLSSPLVPANSGDCTPAQAACLAAPHGGDPHYGGFEVPDAVLNLVSFYSRNLAVPKRRDAADPQVLHGRKMFHEAGATRRASPPANATTCSSSPGS